MARNWTIRRRLGLLAGIAGAAILLNLAASAGVILWQLRPALDEARRAVVNQQRIERIQSLIRTQDALLREREITDQTVAAFMSAQAQIAHEMEMTESTLNREPFAALWRDIQKATRHTRQLVGDSVGPVAGAAGQDDAERPALESLMHMGRLWQEAGVVVSQQRNKSIARATRIHTFVVWFLILSTGACLGACSVGIILTKRWMVRPLGVLQAAASEFAEGRLSHQLPAFGEDEIGDVGREMANLSAKIAELQRLQLDSARQDAAYTNVCRLNDLLRGPLEEIRRLAHAGIHDAGADQELHDSHTTTLQTVEQFDRWLTQVTKAMSRSTMNAQIVSLAELLRDVRVAMQSMLQSRAVALEVEADPGLQTVTADRSQVEHALLAMITNAVEASQPGQSVQVVAAPVSDDVTQWELSVSDEGEGIPNDVRESIGRPFFTTKSDGTGLGLMFVNMVAAAHGGRLIIKSRPDHGSRFTLRLPITPKPSSTRIAR